MKKTIMNLFRKRKKENSSLRPDYFILNKSKVRSNNSFNYRAKIQINSPNWTKSILNKITNQIQTDMGYHPAGYHSFDLEYQIVSEDVIELTWKSWDSCD